MYLHTWILDIITFSFVSNIPIRCSTLSARTSVCNKKRRKCEKNKTICWRRLLPMFFISFAINTDDDQFTMLIQMVFHSDALASMNRKIWKNVLFHRWSLSIEAPPVLCHVPCAHDMMFAFHKMYSQILSASLFSSSYHLNVSILRNYYHCNDHNYNSRLSTRFRRRARMRHYFAHT